MAMMMVAAATAVADAIASGPDRSRLILTRQNNSGLSEAEAALEIQSGLLLPRGDRRREGVGLIHPREPDAPSVGRTEGAVHVPERGIHASCELQEGSLGGAVLPVPAVVPQANAGPDFSEFA